MLAALQHPNIAHLIDGGISADGSPYLALEYVRGCDLLRLLRAAQDLQALPPPAPSADFVPSVTVMISAYNEAAVLEAKLDNTLAIDYPRELFTVVVVSDASDDGTDEIVQRRAALDPRVSLYRQEERRGKTAGLNRGIEFAHGEVVVFSDANAMYETNAIRELVAPLVDPACRRGRAVKGPKMHDIRAIRDDFKAWETAMLRRSLCLRSSWWCLD